MSDTPETDANLCPTGHLYVSATDPHVNADFARKLERERDEARREATDYRDADAETHGVNPTPLPWEGDQ
jgi:hypothetical protein